MKYVHYILRNTLCRGLKFERGRVYNRSVYSGINLISFPPPLHFEIWFSFPIFLTQTHALENCVRPFCILSMSCVYHFQLFNQRRKKRGDRIIYPPLHELNCFFLIIFDIMRSWNIFLGLSSSKSLSFICSYIFQQKFHLFTDIFLKHDGNLSLFSSFFFSWIIVNFQNAPPWIDLNMI